MPKRQSIEVVVYYPKTEEGKRELAQRVATAHADAVKSCLRRLECPSQQKAALLDAIIEDAKARTAQKSTTNKYSPLHNKKTANRS